MQVYSFRDIELSLRREIRNSLKAIWGVGWYRANYISTKLGFAYPFWAGNLNYYLFSGINYLLNKILISKVKAQRNLALIIKNLIELQSYRGSRHALHLPVRGQRTRTNSRTIKRLSRMAFIKNRSYGKNK